MASHCPLCSGRKAKRACPALDRQICPVCCGTKRLTEIPCPPECGYLATSRAHPPAAVRRQQERDLGFILRFMADLTDDQQRLLLLFMGVTLRHAAAALPAPNDADVAEAAAAVSSTLETARRGIIYQHQATSIPAQRLATALEAQLAHLTQDAESQIAQLELDASIVLRQLSKAALSAGQAFGGDDPGVFLTFAKRFIADIAQEHAGAASDPPADAAPRLVIPG